jgi:B12-binding domain/radical SAM domain protein
VVALVLHYRRIARLALDVLLGAVETHPLASDLPVERAESPAALAAAIRRHAAAGRTPVVGWSFFTASFAEVRAELARVRAETAGVRAVHFAGGPHASADPAGTLGAGFDLAAIGEGEETLPALLVALAAGRAPSTVSGLAWRAGERLCTSGRADPIDLDAFPPCAPGAGRIGPLEITRGCVFACRFCQTPFLFHARFRHRSLDGVRRWVRFHAELDTRDVRFLTPSALSWGSPGPGCDLDAIEALLRTAREEAGPARRIFFGSFPSELRPEHVSARALELIRQYCDNETLIIGAQSGSDRLLAAMRRGHRADDVRRAVTLALAVGFTVSVDFVFGVPGETERDRAETRALLVELAEAGARIHAHAFMPLPGTPWQDAAPGRIDPDTAALLERLASCGRAHGGWKSQERLGVARSSAPEEPRKD